MEKERKEIEKIFNFYEAKIKEKNLYSITSYDGYIKWIKKNINNVPEVSQSVSLSLVFQQVLDKVVKKENENPTPATLVKMEILGIIFSFIVNKIAQKRPLRICLETPPLEPPIILGGIGFLNENCEWEIIGSLRNVGELMRNGKIRVKGDVSGIVGYGMEGGEIEIEGNVFGEISGLKKGVIKVKKDLTYLGANPGGIIKVYGKIRDFSPSAIISGGIAFGRIR